MGTEKDRAPLKNGFPIGKLNSLTPRGQKKKVRSPVGKLNSLRPRGEKCRASELEIRGLKSLGPAPSYKAEQK